MKPMERAMVWIVGWVIAAFVVALLVGRSMAWAQGNERRRKRFTEGAGQRIIVGKTTSP